MCSVSSATPPPPPRPSRVCVFCCVASLSSSVISGNGTSVSYGDDLLSAVHRALAVQQYPVSTFAAYTTSSTSTSTTAVQSFFIPANATLSIPVANIHTKNITSGALWVTTHIKLQAHTTALQHKEHITYTHAHAHAHTYTHTHMHTHNMN